jgi:tRNA pseudouridine55 synthase
VRAARPVAPAPVPVAVSRLELTGVEGAIATLRVECSSGFYVRSLAHDLGVVIGVGAHLTELRRTRSGRFRLDQSVSIAELSTAAGEVVPSRLIAMADLLSDLPARDLTAGEEDGVRAGRTVAPLPTRDGAPLQTGFVRLLARDGRLAGIAEIRAGVLHPLVVLM